MAEFYLESIFAGKYHRLVGNESSDETYNHLHSLIKFVTNNDQKIMKYVDSFVRTFYEENEEGDLREFIKTLKSNSLEYVKERDLLPELPRKEIRIWTFSPLEYTDLPKIWTSKWLAIYVAGNIINENKNQKERPDDEFLISPSFFIKMLIF